MELRHIIAARLHLLHRWSCPWASDTPPTRRYIGEYGELVAASWLRTQGLRVLRRNFRWGDSGEVDIVCREGDVLVFIEVKSNAALAHGAPARAVNRRKRELLRRGARNWLRLLNRSIPIRFDIVEVRLPGGEKPIIHHRKAAFTAQEGSASPY